MTPTAAPQSTAYLAGRTIINICCSPALHACTDARGRATQEQLPRAGVELGSSKALTCLINSAIIIYATGYATESLFESTPAFDHDGLTTRTCEETCTVSKLVQ